MELKGSRTEKNLLTAFAGESQARNKYSYWASKARNEGYHQIAALFLEIADQEKEHAKRLFKYLQGGEVEITASFPAGAIGDTLENLRSAAEGERYEHSQMYPEFAAIAKEEGFNEICGVFKAIAIAEKDHDRRYTQIADILQTGNPFKRETSVKWRCRNCGYVHSGVGAPAKCPACDHPQGWFEVMNEI